jgi:hypothetical protein
MTAKLASSVTRAPAKVRRVKTSWCVSIATREFTILALLLSLKNVQRFGTATTVEQLVG